MHPGKARDVRQPHENPHTPRKHNINYTASSLFRAQMDEKKAQGYHRHQPVCEMSIFSPLALLPPLPAPFLEDFAPRTHPPLASVPAVVMRKSSEGHEVSAPKRNLFRFQVRKFTTWYNGNLFSSRLWPVNTQHRYNLVTLASKTSA